MSNETMPVEDTSADQLRAISRRALPRRAFVKTLALGLGAAMLAPALAACSQNGPAAGAGTTIKEGEELTVGVWGGAQEKLVREHIVTVLEKEHKAKINLVLGGTGERRSKAYAEKGKPSFDIIYMNISESKQAVDDGVTQAPTDKVANFANLYDAAKLGGYGVSQISTSIIYDKTKITQPITSWKDLWRPDVKGKLSMPNFPGAEGQAILLMAAKIWGGSEKNVDPGFEKIKELKPFALIHSSQDHLISAFEAGTCNVAIEFGPILQSYIDTKNQNLVVAPLQEGAVRAMNFACITVGTPHQALAEKWINLHLSEACQKAYAETIYYGPTNKSIKLPDDLAKKVVYGEGSDKLVDFDWKYATEKQPEWADRWNKEIAG